jgi:hypothetical protein
VNRFSPAPSFPATGFRARFAVARSSLGVQAPVAMSDGEKFEPHDGHSTSNASASFSNSIEQLQFGQLSGIGGPLSVVRCPLYVTTNN